VAPGLQKDFKNQRWKYLKEKDLLETGLFCSLDDGVQTAICCYYSILPKRFARNGLPFVGNELKKEKGKMEAYCVKCRAKREMREPKDVVFKNGRPATQGKCPTCGSKIFRIGSRR